MFTDCTSGEEKLAFRTNFRGWLHTDHKSLQVLHHFLWCLSEKCGLNCRNWEERRLTFREKQRVTQTGPRNWKERTMQTSREELCPDLLRVGDAVLLKAEKTNKLSSNFCPSPIKVVQKTGSEVTLRNDNDVELKRNSALVKKYMSKKVYLLMLVLQMLTREKPTQTETGKGGDECEPQVPGICQETLRRSTRQVRRPSRLKDFVLSLRDWNTFSCAFQKTLLKTFTLEAKIVSRV